MTVRTLLPFRLMILFLMLLSMPSVSVGGCLDDLGGRLLKESDLPLTGKEWKILEAFRTDDELGWFDNEQTSSSLVTAYLPEDKIARIAEKLTKALKKIEGLDKSVRFRLGERSQINVMKRGHKIGYHYDGPLRDGEPSPYVILIGLSDDYAGGEFLTYNGGPNQISSSTRMTSRSMLILRPDEFHSVKEVTPHEVSGLSDRVTIVFRLVQEN